MKKNSSLKKSSNIKSKNTTVQTLRNFWNFFSNFYKKIFFLFFIFLLESNLIHYKCFEINFFESLRPEQLRAHQISKHNVVCSYCAQRFKDKNNLKRHEKSEHLNNNKKKSSQVSLFESEVEMKRHEIISIIEIEIQLKWKFSQKAKAKYNRNENVSSKHNWNTIEIESEKAKSKYKY